MKMFNYPLPLAGHTAVLLITDLMPPSRGSRGRGIVAAIVSRQQLADRRGVVTLQGSMPDDFVIIAFSPQEDE